MGVPCWMRERRKGMIADVEGVELYRRIVLGGLAVVFGVLSFESVLRLEEGWMRNW